MVKAPVRLIVIAALCLTQAPMRANAQSTVSTAWLAPAGSKSAVVRVKISCNPMISSGNSQEYDVVFQNVGNQPLNISAQMTSGGAQPNPNMFQTVPTLAPGQIYGGALQGDFWDLPVSCSASSMSGVTVWVEEGGISSSSAGSSSTVAEGGTTINCLPAPGQPCPSPSGAPYVPPRGYPTGGGVRANQIPTLSGAQQISVVAAALSRLAYPTEYAAEVAPEYRIPPPNYMDPKYSCAGGKVDAFIVSTLRSVASMYNDYRGMVADDVQSYNNVITGPGGNLAVNVDLARKSLNESVSAREQSFTDDVNSAQQEIQQHCAVLVQRKSGGSTHTTSKAQSRPSLLIMRLQHGIPQGFKLSFAGTQNGIQRYEWRRDSPLGEIIITIYIRSAYDADADSVLNFLTSTGRVAQGAPISDNPTCNSKIPTITVGFHAENEKYAGIAEDFNVGTKHYSILVSAPIDESVPDDVANFTSGFCGA